MEPCPKCKTSGAYVGFQFDVKCTNPECECFDAALASEARAAEELKARENTRHLELFPIYPLYEMFFFT
jgi:hypothetical protein